MPATAIIFPVISLTIIPPAAGWFASISLPSGMRDFAARHMMMESPYRHTGVLPLKSSRRCFRAPLAREGAFEAARR